MGFLFVQCQLNEQKCIYNFDCLQHMKITVKELGQFMLEFVNKNFIPHLQSSIQSHQKSLQRWRQVADMIRDLQKINIWNFESCLKNFDLKEGNNNEKESKQYKKNENGRANSIPYNTQYSYFDEKQALPNSFALQEQVKVKKSQNSNSREDSEHRSKLYKYSGSQQYQAKLSFQSKPVKKKPESTNDPEGFQKLIQSFKKLCTNFQNNHKKLLKQDQNFKQNYKEELVQH